MFVVFLYSTLQPWELIIKVSCQPWNSSPNRDRTDVRLYLKQICLERRARASLLFSGEITYLRIYETVLQLPAWRVLIYSECASIHHPLPARTAAHLIETLNGVTAFVLLIRFKSIRIICLIQSRPGSTGFDIWRIWNLDLLCLI